MVFWLKVTPFASVDGHPVKATVLWYLAIISNEVLDLASSLGPSFSHVNRSANAEADCLAKEGIHHPNLVLFYFYAAM